MGSIISLLCGKRQRAPKENSTLVDHSDPTTLTVLDNDEAFSPPIYSFILSFAAFEKKLLAELQSECQLKESLEQHPDDDAETDTIILNLFRRWMPYHAVETSFRLIAFDMKFRPPGPLDVERVFQVLLNRLTGGWVGENTENWHRFELAKSRNTAFVNSLQRSPTIEFLNAVKLEMDIDDRASWLILVRMFRTLEPEMRGWTSYDKGISSGNAFEIWKLLRLFRNRFERPLGISTLLSFCRKHQDQILERNILERYNEECRRLLVGTVSQDDSGAHIELSGHFDQISESRIAITMENADKHTSLQAVVAGHFDVFHGDELEFIDSTQLYSALSGSVIEAGFRERIAFHPKVRFANPRVHAYPGHFRRLFYQSSLFEHYVSSDQTPLMTLGQQSRLMIVTPLPAQINELFPTANNILGNLPSFWKKWNDCALWILDNEIFLVQTTLGWLFRDISNSLGEVAAIHYFQRLLTWDPLQTVELQKALGQHYQTKYEILLRYIHPKDLENISYLAQGTNGKVLAALWDAPNLYEYSGERPVPVVLKHIRDDGDDKGKLALSKFLQELEITYEALTSSPSDCIRFFGVTVLPDNMHSSAGRLCLVFERATRGTIDNYIKDEAAQLDWYAIVRLFESVAFALKKGLHNRKLLHRDLHPHNVLVTRRQNEADLIVPENDRAVLMDFGRGRRIDNFGANPNVGTLSRNPRELNLHQEYDYNTDIYYLGLLIWDMVIYWMRLSQDCLEMPQDLLEVICRCLSVERNDRPSTDGIIETLERLLDQFFDLSEGDNIEIEMVELQKARNIVHPLLQRHSENSEGIKSSSVLEDTSLEAETSESSIYM